MASGNLFRREQRSHQRQQTQWANRRFHEFRVPFEAALAVRRAAEQHLRERERVRAEAEANRLRELERERIRRERQLRRQQKALLKVQLRQTALANQVLAQQLQEQQQLLMRQQLEDDNTTLSDLRAALPVLLQRARLLQLRVGALVRLLMGSTAPELVLLQQDSAALVLVTVRCDLSRQAVENRHGLIVACDIDEIAQVTRQAVLALQQVMNDQLIDTATVNQCTLDANAGEHTFQHARNLCGLYPNLGLTLALILHPQGPVNTLGPVELAGLNAKLAARAVITWVLACLPRTRPHRSGEWLYVPQTLTNFPYQPSAEIFHDWVWGSVPGHGQAAMTMCQYLIPISTNGQILGTPYTWTQGHNGNFVVSHPNLTLNVVFDATRTMLITYYKLN